MTQRHKIILGLNIFCLLFSMETRAALYGVTSGKWTLDSHNRLRPLGSDNLQNSASLLVHADSPLPFAKWSLQSTLFGAILAPGINQPERVTAVGEVKAAQVRYEANENWDVRFGILQIQWGKTDIVSPTDFFSGRNNTFLSFDDELKRRGAMGAEWTIIPFKGPQLKKFEIQIATMAQYAQTELLLPTSFNVPQFNFDREPNYPSAQAKNFEGGVRAGWNESNYDFGASFFIGHNHFPQISRNAQNLEWSYEPLVAFGGDGSLTLDKWILRAESATFLMRGAAIPKANEGVIEPNHWDTVVGGERTFFGKLRSIFQLTYRTHFAWRDPSEVQSTNSFNTAIDRSVASINSLLQNYQQRSRLGATFSFFYEPEDSDFSFESSVVYNITSGDYFFKPRATYKASENISFIAGVDYYGGPRNQPLGLLKDFSAFSGAIRGYF